MKLVVMILRIVKFCKTKQPNDIRHNDTYARAYPTE